jgi:thiamine kinase-like enzyme
VRGLWPLADYWGNDIDDPRILDGTALVHTDPHGRNFIIDGNRTWLVDWGWAARGPAWVTPMRLALFLIEAGWEPADAEDALASVPAWAEAPPSVITAHAIASAPSWEKAAARQPGNERLRTWAGIARQWADHRAKHPPAPI